MVMLNGSAFTPFGEAIGTEEKLVTSAGEIQAAKAAQRRAELALTASDELAAMIF